jgi:pyruvate kinase
MKLPPNKTKIICTIGPASRSYVTIKELMKNGMSVARLNFSYGTPEDHRKDIEQIKKAASSFGRSITILIDLPGSKIRVGTLENEPTVLMKNDVVTLTTEDVLGTANLLPINYPRLPQSVAKGHTIYLSDGFIQLKIMDIIPRGVKGKVVVGGPLFSSKGVNLPGAKLCVEAVTNQDLAYVDFGLTHGVNTFGASFIQNAHDILKIREHAKKKNKSVNIIAKIERQEAVRNFEEILQVSDAIMIARGDLGLEIPLEDVPITQKRLIRRANFAGRPVITATQMLESMKDNTRPTRAEAADVANAILDGTDAVMLSEETAVGKYPVEAVMMMRRIATAIEQKRSDFPQSCLLREEIQCHAARNRSTITDIISLNVVEAAEALNVRYILTPTASGDTARRVSRFKPSAWIFAFSRQRETLEFLTFSYGVTPFFMKNKGKSWHGPILRFLQEKKMVKNGDKVILTQRRFTKQAGGTDSFGIITIEK